MTKYAPLKKVKDIINHEVIAEVISTGKKICRIQYKVIHGYLIMVSGGEVVKAEIDKTVIIIQQLMKDAKRKHIFSDQFIFTHNIPTLRDAIEQRDNECQRHLFIEVLNQPRE